MIDKYKYLVIEGYITSNNDGDKHFISCEKLVELYNVSKSDCLFIRYNMQFKGHKGTFTILKPRSDGDYNLNNCSMVSI